MESVPDYLDPAKWAAVLDLVPLSDLPPQIHDETERELVFQRNFYRNTHLHQVSGAVTKNLQRDFWAAFRAKYLPSLVDQILDLPPHGARPYGADTPFKTYITPL
ncbi:hypothetical protein PILCRDRAFT_817466 [Piloderma croceum F 1598]|uniref:Uncharacterized protein n=1 Tax=Piloderma croceum (strain F 1598) TaxID=765440 RepID=A0A0C3FMT3_PILCF|nr:hypothetical protein PILCRDRAFT_817466 [Piloderma croceum F 1598]